MSDKKKVEMKLIEDIGDVLFLEVKDEMERQLSLYDFSTNVVSNTVVNSLLEERTKSAFRLGFVSGHLDYRNYAKSRDEALRETFPPDLADRIVEILSKINSSE